MTPPTPPTPPVDALQRETALALWRVIINTYVTDSDHDMAMRDAANAALTELEQ